MMDRETALNTLRLPANASRSAIVAAYSRLARRYPLQQFPERHTRLLQAKTVLLNPEKAFKAILMEETIDLSWLNPYSNKESQGADSDETVPADLLSSPKQCLEALFRPHLKKGVDLFPNAVGFEDECAQIIKALGPGGIEKLINGFPFD
ncbi:MAG: hypothetical protein V3T17_02125 [Pseudomonadales bacterium]